MKIVRHVQGLDFLLYTTATFLSWSHSLLYIKKSSKYTPKSQIMWFWGSENLKNPCKHKNCNDWGYYHVLLLDPQNSKWDLQKIVLFQKNHSNWGFAKSRSCCNNNQSCLHATYFSISSIHHKCEAMKHFAGIFLPLKTFLIIKKFIML